MPFAYFFMLIVPIFLLGGIGILYMIGEANNSNLMYIAMLLPTASIISVISFIIGIIILAFCAATSPKPKEDDQLTQSSDSDKSEDSSEYYGYSSLKQPVTNNKENDGSKT